MKPNIIVSVFFLFLTISLSAQDFNSISTMPSNVLPNVIPQQVISGFKADSETSNPEVLNFEVIDSEEIDAVGNEIIEKDEELSVVETNFSMDSVDPLKQFGYNYLLSGGLDNSVASNSNYILGIGDSLKAYIWGDPVDILELQGQYSLTVDENGSFYFPAVGRVHVLGKSVVEAQNIVIAGLKEKYRRFDLELAVSEFKPFVISVSGMVNKPGQVRCTGLSSIIDVLGRAEGVNKQGSLRNITLKRNGEVFTFDLYDILIKGEGDLNGFLIKEGDSVYVNPIGPVAAVQGAVKRPAIYELTGRETVKDLFEYAGGGLTSTLNRDISAYSLDKNNGDLLIIETGDASILNYRVSDGMIIHVPETVIEYGDSVLVSGELRNPGRFDINNNASLKDLMKNIQVNRDTNMYYAEIERTETGSRKQYFTFLPNHILRGDQNMALKGGDQIHFYSYSEDEPVDLNYYRDIVTLTGVVGDTLTVSWNEGLKLKEILTKSILPVDVNLKYATIIRHSDSESGKEIITFSPEDILSNKVSISLLKLDEIRFYPQWADEPIILSGELANSFVLTFFEGITLMDVFRGVEFVVPLENLRVRVVQDSGVSNIYLYDLLAMGDPKSDLVLEPGASILVQKLSERENRSQIKLLGNVNKPGIINFKEGMTIYDLLSKAGGLRGDAYLKGLVLFRRSARITQQEQLDITLNTLATQLQSIKMEAEKASISPEAKAAVMAQSAIQESLLQLTREKAQKALGRIALNLPDSMEELKGNPDNIELEEGDSVYIPKTPDYVLVLGNVYNQISISYDSQMTVEDYLNRIGGLKKDSGDAYIVHLDGQITSSDSIGFFEKKIKNRTLNPGDVIVVPQDIKVPAHILFYDTFERVVDVLYKTSTTVLSTFGLLNMLGAF